MNVLEKNNILCKKELEMSPFFNMIHKMSYIKMAQNSLQLRQNGVIKHNEYDKNEY